MYFHCYAYTLNSFLSQGLGKSSDGRLEPVKIEILPPGKSLDACAAMRESKNRPSKINIKKATKSELEVSRSILKLSILPIKNSAFIK